MQKSPKISCVMCVYNTKEAYLREAIESILNQTFSDFELLIVDDGSTAPHVKKVIQSYHDPRVKYLYKKNQGKVAFARNYGNSKASGEYIAVMDSDDISLPDRFQKEVEFLDAHPEYFGVGGALETFPKKEIWYAPEYPCILDCLKDNIMTHSASMYRREQLSQYHLQYGTQFHVGEDYYLWAHVLMSGLKLYNFQEVLFLYRRDGQGMTTKKKSNEIAQDIQAIKADIMQFLTGHNQKWKTFLESYNEDAQKYYISLFGLPFLKVKIKGLVQRYYLFNCIPLLKIKKHS